ncbi:MAG TPA: hypothetical protein VGM82_10445 [Gemmatimonadaceae bacterium]|jgi:hypothetical protein
MATLTRSGNLPLRDVARAMSYDGWVIDSVSLSRIEAHRRVGQLIESVGAEPWFNDGHLTIERTAEGDTISFRHCVARWLVVSVASAAGSVWFVRSPIPAVLIVSFGTIAGALLQFRARKPIEQAAVVALTSGEWDII